MAARRKITRQRRLKCPSTFCAVCLCCVVRCVRGAWCAVFNAVRSEVDARPFCQKQSRDKDASTKQTSLCATRGVQTASKAETNSSSLHHYLTKRVSEPFDGFARPRTSNFPCVNEALALPVSPLRRPIHRNHGVK